MWDVEDSQQDQLAGLLRDLGYTGREMKYLLRKIGEVADEASRTIWRWSAIKEWGKDKTS